MLLGGFWDVWGLSGSLVGQALQQKRKNARQKSPKIANLVGTWSQVEAKIEVKISSENRIKF